MKRRDFLKQTGLATVLIGSGTALNGICRTSDRKLPLPLGPRPQEWIEVWRRQMVGYLVNGHQHNWLPPYTQPSRDRGWLKREQLPLNLTPIFAEQRIPEENKHLKETFTYSFSILESRLGRIRVDYLERNMQSVCPKLFLLNHEGRELGGCGIFYRPFTFKYRDFPSGIRHGTNVFQVTGLSYSGSCKNQPLILTLWESRKVQHGVA